MLLVLAAAAVLAVPYVGQEKDTCGAAALTMVLRYWGQAIDHDEAVKLLEGPETGGIRGSKLAELARERGFTAITYRGDLAHLGEQIRKGRPLIVAWKVKGSRYHDVVVVGLDDRNVFVHDPDRGASRPVSRKDFEKRWAGAEYWTLLIAPPAK